MSKNLLGSLLVTDALRDARRRFQDDEAVRGPALQQARLLGEIAGRVAEPAEPLPPGDRAPVILRLLRDAVTQVLSTATAAAPAGEGAAAPEAPGFEQVWDQAPEEMLREAAETPADVAVIRETLRPAGAVKPGDEQAVTRARTFLDRLLWNADAPRRRVESLLIQRALRVAGALVVLVLVGAGIRVLAHGKNLLEGKPFSVSSNWSGCATDSTCEGVLLFHTNNENEPWVIFDLQKPTTLHEIEVTNRQDSYQERAVPLVAELSTDRVHWKEVGRRADVFSTWTIKFPPTAVRYIRLKVARVSTLHLKAVEAR